jgi:hypothetical protein
MSKLRATERALAYRLGIWGATFVMVALMLAVLNPVKADVASTASNMTDSSQASTGLDYTQAAWDMIPVLTGLLGMVMLLAGVAVEATGGGR